MWEKTLEKKARRSGGWPWQPYQLLLLYGRLPGAETDRPSLPHLSHVSCVWRTPSEVCKSIGKSTGARRPALECVRRSSKLIKGPLQQRALVDRCFSSEPYSSTLCTHFTAWISVDYLVISPTTRFKKQCGFYSLTHGSDPLWPRLRKDKVRDGLLPGQLGLQVE